MIRRPVVADTPPPFIILLGLLLVGTVVTAQVPARDKPSTPRAGTGVIRGRVVRADTGEPLRRVQVRVDEWSTGDRSGPAATMTDAEGRYELTQLPAGRYQVADGTDWVSAYYRPALKVWKLCDSQFTGICIDVTTGL